MCHVIKETKYDKEVNLFMMLFLTTITLHSSGMLLLKEVSCLKVMVSNGRAKSNEVFLNCLDTLLTMACKHQRT